MCSPHQTLLQKKSCSAVLCRFQLLDTLSVLGPTVLPGELDGVAWLVSGITHLPPRTFTSPVTGSGLWVSGQAETILTGRSIAERSGSAAKFSFHSLGVNSSTSLIG